MYLLFLDESGTHGGSPVFVLGGLAVHEDDAYHLQQKLESFLHGKLAHPPLSLDATRFEIHATDIKNGKHEWKAVPNHAERMSVLGGIYSTLINYDVRNSAFPLLLFGAVVDKAKVPNLRNREQLAYELVLNKFDDMLRRINRTHRGERGLVVHDQRVIHGGTRAWTAERAIQEWTKDWREAAGRVGRLMFFADIPLFADSRASRLIQAADCVAFALWRHYGLKDEHWLRRLLEHFDVVGGVMHGLIHVSRDYATGSCECPPCENRLSRGLDPARP